MGLENSLKTCAKKVKYKSRKEARLTAKKQTIKQQQKRNAYKCDICDGYHLTRNIQLKYFADD